MLPHPFGSTTQPPIPSTYVPTRNSNIAMSRVETERTGTGFELETVTSLQFRRRPQKVRARFALVVRAVLLFEQLGASPRASGHQSDKLAGGEGHA
jgi:hypothetical protein